MCAADQAYHRALCPECRCALTLILDDEIVLGDGEKLHRHEEYPVYWREEQASVVTALERTRPTGQRIYDDYGEGLKLHAPYVCKHGHEYEDVDFRAIIERRLHRRYQHERDRQHP